MAETTTKVEMVTVASWTSFLSRHKADWALVGEMLGDGSRVQGEGLSGLKGLIKGDVETSDDGTVTLDVQWLDAEGNAKGKPTGERLGTTCIPCASMDKLPQRVIDAVADRVAKDATSKAAEKIAKAWSKQDAKAKEWLLESGRAAQAYLEDTVNKRGLSWGFAVDALRLQMEMHCGCGHKEDVARNRQIAAACTIIAEGNDELFLRLSIRAQKAFATLVETVQPSKENPCQSYQLVHTVSLKKAQTIFAYVLDDNKGKLTTTESAVFGKNGEKRTDGVLIGEQVDSLVQFVKKGKAPATPATTTTTTATESDAPATSDGKVALSEKPALAAAQVTEALTGQGEGAGVVLSKVGETIGEKGSIGTDDVVALFMGVCRAGKLTVAESILNACAKELAIYSVIMNTPDVKKIRDERKQRDAALAILAQADSPTSAVA